MSIFQKQLKVARIPTPSRLMAEMIALRIAKIKPEAKHSEIETVVLDVAGGRKIEVQCRRAWDAVQVAMLGKPNRYVALNTEEQKIISDVILQLRELSQSIKREEAEFEKQNVSLTILESLL